MTPGAAHQDCLEWVRGYRISRDAIRFDGGRCWHDYPDHCHSDLSAIFPTWPLQSVTKARKHAIYNLVVGESIDVDILNGERFDQVFFQLPHDLHPSATTYPEQSSAPKSLLRNGKIVNQVEILVRKVPAQPVREQHYDRCRALAQPNPDNPYTDSNPQRDLSDLESPRGIGRSEVRCSSHQFKPFFIECHGAFQ